MGQAGEIHGRETIRTSTGDPSLTKSTTHRPSLGIPRRDIVEMMPVIWAAITSTTGQRRPWASADKTAIRTPREPTGPKTGSHGRARGKVLQPPACAGAISGDCRSGAAARIATGPPVSAPSHREAGPSDPPGRHWLIFHRAQPAAGPDHSG